MSLQRDKHEGQRVAQRERECMAWREAPCERERLKKKKGKARDKERSSRVGEGICMRER
jgi:hypothetical protein